MSMSTESVDLSVVVPVYCSADIIGSTVEEIVSRVGPWCPSYEIILVNDGSPDGSYEAICHLAQESERIRVLDLARNFGQHNASMAGLNEARGQRIVIIDDDGQHDPACIRKMCEKLDEGADVVYVRYDTKIDAVHKNLGSWINDHMSTHLLGKPSEVYLSSFKAVSRTMRDECIRYRGPFVYLDGIILRATHHIAIVPARHRPTAKAKRSTYSLGRLLALWLNMFTNFSIMPLRAIFVFGGAMGVLAVGAILTMILLYISDPGYAPPGWTTIFVLILLFGSFQLLAIGLIGEYVGRILLLLNQRPQYVIKSRG